MSDEAYHYDDCELCERDAKSCTCPVGPQNDIDGGIKALIAEIERLQRLVSDLTQLNNLRTAERDALLSAGRRSLNWLASYPGGGALGCYDEMRDAVDPLESVLTGGRREKTTGAALFELDQCRRQFPELRLCQIIVNATGRNDPFYVTDDELYEKLMAYRKQHEPTKDYCRACGGTRIQSREKGRGAEYIDLAVTACPECTVTEKDSGQ